MDGTVMALVRAAFGDDVASRCAQMVVVSECSPGDASEIGRADLAMALALALFDDLVRRAPTGQAYVKDVVARGNRITFDHGALRTIRFASGQTGQLPAGEQAFRRILEPLGYREVGLYPLPALKMTGRAYAHEDAPSEIPQYFLSELHVDQFSLGFGEVAHRVFDSSVDPLDARVVDALADLSSTGALPFEEAVTTLPTLAAAFDRHHDEPNLADYAALLAESPEAAWIATEGNAFNHATDRVADVIAVAAAQRSLGRPIKDAVECSASGRVRQTAFHADVIARGFQDHGERVEREVPGSFYEFITREIDPDTGLIDLRFDSGNATGIFGMTRAHEPAE